MRLRLVSLYEVNEHLCLRRSIAADFKEDVTFKGIKGFKYSAGFGDMSKDPELKCFCTTPETCWKQGLHDLTRCQGECNLNLHPLSEKIILYQMKYFYKI